MNIENFKEDLKDLGRDFTINEHKDFVVESHKVVFEYCIFNLYCENISGDHRTYHAAKQKVYMEAGYNFYIIFEDEYVNKRTIVLARIKNLLNVNPGEKVYARKCVVREIETKVSSKFVNQFHIQGNSGSRVKLGLFKHNGLIYNELVSVLTMGGLSRAKGNKNVGKNSWELVRFCSDSAYRVIGAAGKLLKNFERNYEWESILTFADRRWSPTGNLYRQIGFEFHSITQPNYYYLKLPAFDKRCHRFAFRRDVLRRRAVEETNLSEEKILSMTEFELAKTLNYDRIWDAGNFKFIKYNKGE